MNYPEAINVVDVIKDESIIEIKGEIIHCEDDDYEGDYEYDEDEDEIEVEDDYEDDVENHIICCISMIIIATMIVAFLCMM
jgi:hypothetical protein